MRVFVKSLLITVMLVSCGGNDSRYRDTQLLERPPSIVVTKPAGEPRIIDNSKIPKKKYEKGLGSDVSMSTTTPPQLIIKQSYDDAWSTLGIALKQSEIEITDREHDKGLYYVSYDPEHSFFSNKHDQSIYVLTVENEGAETKISATLGNATEQSSAGKRSEQGGHAQDDSATPSAEGAEKLLQSLYETIRDDLKEE